MTRPPQMQLLRVACVLALMALGLMAWSLFDPRVFPVVVAMSLGQILGTASFAVFGWVVLKDFRAMRRLARANRTDARPPGSDAT